MKKKQDDERKVEDKKGVVGSFLESIPGFGNFFKQLGKSEVFQTKFEEANEKIEENLRQGAEKKWNVEGNISVRPLAIRPSMRPLVGALKKETPEAELLIEKDYAYGKKGNKLLLAVKVHQENADLSIKGKTLFIKGSNFQKKIRMPDFYKSITKKHYKKGVLMLELTK